MWLGIVERGWLETWSSLRMEKKKEKKMAGFKDTRGLHRLQLVGVGRTR